MKLTKSQLKSIIKEELNKMVSEATPRKHPYGVPDVPDAPPEYVKEPRGEPAEPDLPENPRLHEPTFSVYSYMTTEQLRQLLLKIQSDQSEGAKAEIEQIKAALARRE